MKRLYATLLFAAIALLLSAKVTLNIWLPLPAGESGSQVAAATSAVRSVVHVRPVSVNQHAKQTHVAPEPEQSGGTAPAEIASAPRQAASPSLPEHLSAALPSATLSVRFSVDELAKLPLAKLAAYLIPAANAEANSAEQAIIEDKTLASLRQYRNQLDARAAELDKQEASLKAAEEQLKQRITELEQLEASIQQRLQDEAKIKSKKIKRLTAVYQGMKPDKAAPVIAQMELATVVKIFLQMDEKKVGKILSYLPPDKAVRISQAMTRQISTVK